MASYENRILVQCSACEGTVSRKAKLCPHCGQSKPAKNTRKEISKPVAYFIIFIFIIGAVPTIFQDSYSNSHLSAEVGDSEKDRELCVSSIRRSVINPSTLSIDVVTGFGRNVDQSGIRRITQTFSAQNAFGLKKKFDAYCTITAGEKMDVKIVEQGR